MTRNPSRNLAYFAAAAVLATAGAASAQILPRPTLPSTGLGVGAGATAQTPAGSAIVQGQIKSSGAVQTPPLPATPQTTAPPTTAPLTPPAEPTAMGAETAATPSSATIAAALAAGAAVKDPSGAEIGVIAGDGTAADGSATVLVSQGDKKFALPRNSLSVGADGMVSTTATKAQIDATLAGALKAK